ncbi:hypothetical protein MBLNU459_g5402t1 [Dothideomycetes sp. NU459]
MSALYNLEPPPTAKVLLNTTSGELVLELFAKQAPLASRNFLQHCLDGYYDNTIFHRLVPGFIIQGGDPTGLGTGGVSAINNGAPFADEHHSRLKFNRRGLLGMANSGEPDDNTSQFFLTLDKTPELQGKNTMFGRIEGDTIYNLIKMAEADLTDDGGDRPLYPTRVTSTEILLNPFADMVKNMHIAERTGDDAPKFPKKKRKAGKNLLSFGADEGDDGPAPVVKKAKVNPNFVTPASQDNDGLATGPNASNPRPERAAAKSAPTESVPPVRQIITAPAADVRAPASAPALAPTPRAPSLSPDPPPVVDTTTLLEKTNAQIAELKASMKRTTGTAKAAPEKKKSALEAMIPETSTRGRKRGKVADEKGALDMFNAFKKRLVNVPHAPVEPQGVDKEDATKTADPAFVDAEVPAAAALDTEERLCDLHFIANCQSCSSWDKEGREDDDEDNDDDANWMSHTLSFAKDTLGKDLEWKRKMEEFEVIDPREKTKEIVQDRKKDQFGDRDWDRPRDKGRSKTKK